MTLFSFLRRKNVAKKTPRCHCRRVSPGRSRVRLALEVLENRLVPSVVFSENFEELSNGNLGGQGGWTINHDGGIPGNIPGAMELTDPGPHLPTRVVNGFDRLSSHFPIAQHAVSLPTTGLPTITMTFDAYGSSSESNNSGVGFASFPFFVGGPDLDLLSWQIDRFDGGWDFASQISDASSGFQTHGGYDVPAHLSIVIDEQALTVYGRWDFGGGNTGETPHYPVSLDSIQAINNVVVFQDWRPGSGGIEADNILIQSQDATHFSVSAPANTTAGTSFNVTVTALDADGNTATDYTGKVHFTTSDIDSGVVLPPDYTFTAADQGTHTFTGVALVTPGSQTITATDTTTSSITGTATITVAAPDVAVKNARWVPLSEHQEDASIIRFDYSATNYTGPVNVHLYASDGLTQDLLASQTLNVAAGQSGTAEFRVRSGPSTASFLPTSLIIVADPVPHEADSDLANNRTSLSIHEPGRLSFELQADAPLADTRKDRVELWLRRYRAKINSTAQQFRIAPEAIAGAIAWEALNNVHSLPLFPLYGPGKVHPFELNGESNAEAVERLGYLPRVSLLRRILILRTPEGAIDYIGAIMGAFADTADRAGSQANIRNRSEILATLYNGVTFRGVPVRLNNALAFFRFKVAHGDSYAPGPTMGLWVQQNFYYLHGALSL